MNHDSITKPKRGWNNEAYEPKTHWRHKNGESAYCGTLHSFYQPIKFAEHKEQVTCQRCKRAQEVKA